MFTKAQQGLDAFLRSQSADPSTYKRLGEGSLGFNERVDYARKDIGNASGTTALINETISKADGTCSIHQGKLPENVYVSYEKIGMAFETTGSTDVSPDADPLYSPDMQTWDDALRNGVLFVKQDDNVKLELPCSILGTYADSEANPKQVAYELSAPLILEPGKQIEVEIKFPNAVDNTVSTSHNVEIVLYGVGTKSRG